MSQVVLALIATTVVAIALFCWSMIYYVPRILGGDDHADASHPEAGRPS